MAEEKKAKITITLCRKGLEDLRYLEEEYRYGTNVEILTSQLIQKLIVDRADLLREINKEKEDDIK